jgi:hypothetical protein
LLRCHRTFFRDFFVFSSRARIYTTAQKRQNTSTIIELRPVHEADALQWRSRWRRHIRAACHRLLFQLGNNIAHKFWQRLAKHAKSQRQRDALGRFPPGK